MKKSDLRSGMLVTLRNHGKYYVMLNTGIWHNNDVLLQRCGDSMGWMPLSHYDDNLEFHSDPDDILYNGPTPEQDHEWDIVAIEAVEHVTGIGIKSEYKTAWTREEVKP